MSTNFESIFEAFAKYGDITSNGKLITLSQSDKWMKQANVFDGKITKIDTAIHFKKTKLHKIDLIQYNKFLDDLAATKKMPLNDIKSKMISCGEPAIPKVAKHGKVAATVSRLTNSSRYTGSHKARFDKHGKGKGIAGRKEIIQNEGYVSGYKNKDTYEEPQNN